MPENGLKKAPLRFEADEKAIRRTDEAKANEQSNE